MAVCPAPDSGSIGEVAVWMGASALAFFFLALLDSEGPNGLDTWALDMADLWL